MTLHLARVHRDAVLLDLAQRHTKLTSAHLLDVTQREMSGVLEGESELDWSRELARAELRHLLLTPLPTMTQKPPRSWPLHIVSFTAKTIVTIAAALGASLATAYVWFTFGPQPSGSEIEGSFRAVAILLGGAALSIVAGVATMVAMGFLWTTVWLVRKL